MKHGLVCRSVMRVWLSLNGRRPVGGSAGRRAVAVLAVGLPLLTGCNQKEAAAPPAERPSLTVATTVVVAREVSSRVLATGTVAAWREVAVGSEANGLAVREVAVEEGARVRRGDLLVQLNDASLQAESEQQTAMVEEAKANLDLAEIELRRSTLLIGSNAVSQQTIEERRNAVRANTAKLNSAKALLSKLAAERDKTRIVAVADGIISKRSVHPGMVVASGATLLTLIQDGRLQLDAAVAEASLTGLSPGQQVRVIAASGEALTGTVRELAPLVDKSSRLGTVRIDLPSDTRLRPGMFARVEFASAPAIALTAPRRALVWRGHDAHVFTISRAGKAELRKVRLGRSAGEDVEILEGLAERDQVVSAGAGFLSDGDRVAVVKSLAANDGAIQP